MGDSAVGGACAHAGSAYDRGRCSTRRSRHRHRFPRPERRAARQRGHQEERSRRHRAARLPAQPPGRGAVPRHPAHGGHRGPAPDPAVHGGPAGGRAGRAGPAGLRHDRVQRGHAGAARSSPGRADGPAPGRRRDGRLGLPGQAAPGRVPARPDPAGDGGHGGRRRAADRHRRRGRRPPGHRPPAEPGPPPDRLRRRHRGPPGRGRARPRLVQAADARLPAGS